MLEHVLLLVLVWDGMFYVCVCVCALVCARVLVPPRAPEYMCRVVLAHYLPPLENDLVEGLSKLKVHAFHVTRRYYFTRAHVRCSFFSFLSSVFLVFFLKPGK